MHASTRFYSITGGSVKARRFIQAMIIILAVLWPAMAQFVMPTAVPLPGPRVQFLDTSGDPLAGGKIYTYEAGTSTPLATYTDSTGGTPNANPVVLDSGGFADIWIKGESYKIVAKDSDDVTQWTVDNLNDTTFWYLVNLASISDAALLSYTHSQAAAVQTTVRAKLDEVLSVKDFDAAGDGVTDDTDEIKAVIAAARDDNRCVFFPPGNYIVSSVVDLQGGDCLFGHTASQRWRSAIEGTKLTYSGTIALFRVAPGAGVGAESILISNMHLEGTSATGAVDGVYLDGTAGSGAYIEGVEFDDVAITNFPQSQVHAEGTVFDITFHRLHANNADRAVTEALVWFEYDAAVAPASQVTLDDCYLLPYTSGEWAFYSDTITDVRFIAGTVAPYHDDSHGVWVAGGLSVFGTHFEGLDGSTTSICIRYTGTNGAQILPSSVAACSIGVQVGSTANTALLATGVFIAGGITNNTTAEVQIVDGAARNTVIAQLGASPTISNLRETTDAVYNEVLYLFDADFRRKTVTMGDLDMYATDGIAQTDTANALQITTPAGSVQPILVKTTNDAKVALTLRANSASQSANILDVQNSASVTIAGFDNEGAARTMQFTFANLGAATVGKMKVCTDCNVASPCTSGGSGALAVGIGGAWVCK